MKKAIAVAMVSLGALACVPVTSLADGLYVGGDYTRLQYNSPDDNSNDYINPDAATLRVGGESGPLGLEVRGSVGLDSDTKNGIKYKMDNMYGGYLKLSAPVATNVRPYIIGGYTKVKSTAHVDRGLVTVKKSDTSDGGSWGAGLDLAVSDSLALNLEYMRYLNQDNMELSGISLGLRSAW